jgi:hypothetical protein
MQGEVFLASVAIHLLPHRFKHLRIAGDWADGEQLQISSLCPLTGDYENKRFDGAAQETLSLHLTDL